MGVVAGLYAVTPSELAAVRRGELPALEAILGDPARTRSDVDTAWDALSVLLRLAGHGMPSALLDLQESPTLGDHQYAWLDVRELGEVVDELAGCDLGEQVAAVFSLDAILFCYPEHWRDGDREYLAGQARRLAGFLRQVRDEGQAVLAVI